MDLTYKQYLKYGTSGLLNNNAIDNYVVKVLKLLENKTCFENKNELKKEQQYLEDDLGGDCIAYANKMLVYKAFSKYAKIISQNRLPERVEDLQIEDVKKIVGFAETGKKDFLNFENEQFYKYLNVLILKLIPLGHQWVEISGIPKSILYKQKKLKKTMCCIKEYYRLGGFAPLYEMHYNPFRLRQFNLKGWEDVLRNCGELLKNNHRIRGCFGGAWFFDPALVKISPEFSYIHELINVVGGNVYYACQTDDDKINAFAMSAKRRKAAEEGRYTPKSYVVVFNRKELVRFANNK